MHISGSMVRTGFATVLTRLASAALVFELITGLAVTFGPFHAAVEWGLVLHTVIGVLTLLPVAWYLWRHFEDYRGQAMSDVLLLGYVALAGLAVCSASGVVVTWQGLLGIRTTPAWRYTHLISTLVTL